VNYVYAGYGVTVGVLGLYAIRVLWRGRSLRRVLGPPPAADSTSDTAT
jgi:hypothetical protein